MIGLVVIMFVVLCLGVVLGFFQMFEVFIDCCVFYFEYVCDVVCCVFVVECVFCIQCFDEFVLVFVCEFVQFDLVFVQLVVQECVDVFLLVVVEQFVGLCDDVCVFDEEVECCVYFVEYCDVEVDVYYFGCLVFVVEQYVVDVVYVLVVLVQFFVWVDYVFVC